MNKKIWLIGLSSIFLLSSVHAKENKHAINAEKMPPLKQILMVMAEPQPINVDTDADKYLKIKGTKGWSRKMEQGINSYFFNNGNIKLEVLGWSDIALDGESQHVAHI